MTWASAASLRTLHPLWWMRISGIPYVWATGKLPTQWDAGGGTVEIGDRDESPESYTWSPTLAPDTRWEMSKQESEPWSGQASGGVVPLSVILPGTLVRYGESNPWLDLLAIAPRRTANAKLTKDLSPTATTVNLTDVTDFQSSGTIYGKLEAVTYTGKGSGTLTGLTRGRWWSLARHHVASWDGGFEDAALGGVWTTHPLIYEGRIAWLMCSLGYRDANGNWQPLDSSAEGVHTRQFWRGIVRRVEPSEDRGKVTIQCSPLTEILSTKVATRLPRGRLGHSPEEDHLIYVGSDNNKVTVIVDNNGTNEGGCYRKQLQRSDGVGGSTNVVAGYYPASDIAEFIGHTIEYVLTTRANETTFWMAIGRNPDGEVKAACAVRVTSTSSDYDDVLISIDTSWPDSIWLELGFTDNIEVPQAAVSPAGTRSWFLEPQRPVPIVRLPRWSKRPIPVHALEGPGFLTTTGWLDDNGANVRGYCKIDDREIFSIASVTTSEGTAYITPFLRWQYGSSPDDGEEEIYVELTSDVDPPTIVQGLALYNVNVGRRFRYLLETGHGDATNGSYDEGWRGCGAYCDPDLVAGDQVVAAPLVSPLAGFPRRWVTFEPISVRDAIADDCVSHMLSPVADFDDDESKCTIRLAYIGPPSDDETGVIIDHETIDSTLGIPWDENTDRLVNTVRIEGIGRNWASGEDEEVATWVSGHSLGTYGHRDPVDIDLSTFIPGAIQNAAQVLAEQLAGMGFDEPFAIGGLPITRAYQGWTLRIGDVVIFSNDDILNPLTAERGITGILGRVFAISRTLWSRQGDRTMFARAWCYFLGWMGKRRGKWTPTARVNAISGGTTLVIDDHWNSHQNSPKDVFLFRDDYRVRVFNAGNEASAVVRTVVSTTEKGTDLSEVEVDSSVSLTPPCRLEWAKHDDASIEEDQLKRVYFSDGSGKLDLDAGFALAFYYVG